MSREVLTSGSRGTDSARPVTFITRWHLGPEPERPLGQSSEGEASSSGVHRCDLKAGQVQSQLRVDSLLPGGSSQAVSKAGPPCLLPPCFPGLRESKSSAQPPRERSRLLPTLSAKMTRAREASRALAGSSSTHPQPPHSQAPRPSAQAPKLLRPQGLCTAAPLPGALLLSPLLGHTVTSSNQGSPRTGPAPKPQEEHLRQGTWPRLLPLLSSPLLCHPWASPVRGPGRKRHPSLVLRDAPAPPARPLTVTGGLPSRSVLTATQRTHL